MKHNSLGINAILNTLKTTLGVVFPLITFPYVSRILQVEKIGVYNFSLSITSYFVLLAGLGISTYAIREGTQYRGNKENITRFVSEVFSINVWSTIISYILLALAIIFVQALHAYSLGIIILSTEIAFTTLGVSWVCNIFEDFFFIALQSIGVQVVSLILIFTLVKNPEDLYLYIAIVAFSKSASFVINFFYVRVKYCKFRFIVHCNLREHIKPILVIFSTTIAITIYVNSDVTMLGLMTNDYQVGLYSTSVKIYTIVKNILAAVLMVLIPRFSLLFQQGKGSEADALFSQIFNILFALLLPASVGLFVTSQDVVFLVGGINYLEGTIALKLLCIAIFFSLIAYLYTQCILIPKKKESIVLKATALSASVNVVLNFVFIPFLGINGAAVTTIIAEAIVCIVAVVYSKNDIHLRISFRDCSSTILGCIGIAAVSAFCRGFFAETFALRLSVTIIGSVMVYFTILLVTKNSVVVNMTSKMRKKIMQ